MSLKECVADRKIRF